MDLYLAGDCSGFKKISPKLLGERGIPHLLSFGHPKGKASTDEYIKGVKEMDLYLVGPEKNNILEEVIDKDKNNLLISYDTPNLIQKEINRRKDKMDLYLAGLQSYGNENQEKIKEGKINNLLFSFDRKNDCSRSIEINNKSKLFIDSGAFTAWTKGKKIDIDEYIKFINERSEYIHIYCQLDVIPGEVHRIATKEEGIEAGKKTWENYLYMYPKMKEPQKMLYCFHLGEPLEWFQRALEWKDENGNQMQYIAIGGIMGKPKDIRIKFLTKIEELIKNSSNPNVKIHALGMTSFDVLDKFPFITSADSTSWIMTGANGMIMTNYGPIIVSNKQNGDFKHYNNLPEDAKKVVDEEIKKYGFTIDDLKESRDNRLILNAKYMQDKAKNIVYKPLKKTNRLF